MLRKLRKINLGFYLRDQAKQGETKDCAVLIEQFFLCSPKEKDTVGEFPGS